MSGLAEAFDLHRFNKALAVCSCGLELGGQGNRMAAHRAHLADVAHRWYAERLGSEDVREAVARALYATASEPTGRKAEHIRTALRAALTERGDRG
jgi:hypothetical protein